MASNTQIMKQELGEITLDANGREEIRTMGQAFCLAKFYEEAGMLPKGCSAAGATIRIQQGRLLGMPAMQSMQGIADINGRPCLWGDAMHAICMASGLLEDESVEYFPKQSACKQVRYSVKRKGIPTPYVGVFSYEQAEKAGLTKKTGPWQQYPERMIFNRARAFALRDAFPDVLQGMYSVEELRDAQDSGDVIDGDFREMPAPMPKPKAKSTRAPASDILPAPEAQPETLDVPPAAEEAPVAPVAPAAPAEPAEHAKTDALADF